MILLFLSLLASASPRIEATHINRLEPHKIFMTFGRSTVIVMPCNVVSFSDGPTKDIQALLNERDSKMLEVWFLKNSPEPQELKVFCQDEKYVFDIMPNKYTHQSIFEVTHSFRSRKVEFEKSDEIKKPKVLKVLKSSNGSSS
ncbi:MAG: hypothetical protein WA160_06945 [Pseudobdellovibrio sp.]